IIVQTASLLVLCYGGVLVVQRDISLGQFVQFMLYTALLVYPMVELGSVMGFYQRARVSMARINEVMSIKPIATGNEHAVVRTEMPGEIEFRDLTFTYPGALQPALSHIDLHIRAGRTVAFLGPVGSGKSTLISLVPRVFEAG